MPHGMYVTPTLTETLVWRVGDRQGRNKYAILMRSISEGSMIVNIAATIVSARSFRTVSK